MEEEIKIEEIVITKDVTKNNQQQIAGAIVIAGLLIAGAILLKGNSNPVANNKFSDTKIAQVGPNDRTLGNPKAKVTVVLYEDFQCPFCGAVSGLENNTPLIQALKQRDSSWSPFMTDLKPYIDSGKVQLVYRDYSFLGQESLKSAEAARCAGDQGKFWEYHDYLYGHQKGENEGAFSDKNLKSFAKILNLDSASFDTCLDSGKHNQEVLDSKAEGDKAGVTGTPKGFILKKGQIVDTIEGAESSKIVMPKIETALK